MGQPAGGNSQQYRMNVGNHYHQTQQNMMLSQSMQLDGSHSQHPNSNATAFTFGSGMQSANANQHMNSMQKHGNAG